MRYTHKKIFLRVVRRPKLMRLIHAALASHLFLVSVILALISGASTYYLRSQEVAEGVLDTVLHEAESARMRIEELAAERKMTLRKAAMAVLGYGPPGQLDARGRFVSVEICGADGATVPVWNDPYRYASVRSQCFAGGKAVRPSSGRSSHEILQHEGRLYVLVRTPLSADPEHSEGEAHITFLLSPKTQKELERAGVDNAVLAAVFVFLTTLAMYPAMVFLARRTGKLTERLLHSNLEMLQVLGSAVAQRDADTDEHNYRVSLYSVRLAEAVNLRPPEMRRLLKGAFLHDIGKIGIPDRILRKPGPLSDDEMRVMREHVPLGLDIIFRSAWLSEAAEVVGCHHERVDGTGYPKGISDGEIPLTARIFAIADVFDALCSRRPYKEALSAEEAIGIMRRESGRHFDPRLFGAFESIAFDLHARYADRQASELRAELNDILSSVFSDRISRLVRQ